MLLVVFIVENEMLSETTKHLDALIQVSSQ